MAKTKPRVSGAGPGVAAASPSRGAKSRVLPELDRLIHERMRLGIVSGLVQHTPDLELVGLAVHHGRQ